MPSRPSPVPRAPAAARHGAPGATTRPLRGRRRPAPRRASAVKKHSNPSKKSLAKCVGAQQTPFPAQRAVINQVACRAGTKRIAKQQVRRRGRPAPRLDARRECEEKRRPPPLGGGALRSRVSSLPWGNGETQRSAFFGLRRKHWLVLRLVVPGEASSRQTEWSPDTPYAHTSRQECRPCADEASWRPARGRVPIPTTARSRTVVAHANPTNGRNLSRLRCVPTASTSTARD